MEKRRTDRRKEEIIIIESKEEIDERIEEVIETIEREWKRKENSGEKKSGV